MSLYELAIVGDVTPTERARLTQTLTGMLSAFDLNIGQDVVLRDARGLGERDIRAATAAAYFGTANQTDVLEVRELVQASVPIIPTVSATTDFAQAVPEFLLGLNGLRRRADDEEMAELAAAMLECVGLLRRQRRRMTAAK